MSNLNKTDEGIFQNIEFNRFGLICAVLLVVGCLGGLTVGMGAVEHIWSLVVIVVPTMITISLLLAVSPMRYILLSASITVAIDLIFVLYYLFT